MTRYDYPQPRRRVTLQDARWYVAAAIVGVVGALILTGVTGESLYHDQPDVTVLVRPTPDPTLTPPTVGPTGAVVGQRLAEGVAP